MCMITSAGLAIATLAAAAISTGMQAASASKAEKANAKYNMSQTQAELINYTNQVNQENNRYSQEVTKAHQEQQQTYLENLQAQATAQASAAGSGVAGSSIENLFRGYERATNLSNYMTETNLRNMGLQFDENYKGLTAQAMSSINTQQRYTGQTARGAILSGIGNLLSTSAQVGNQYLK